MDWAACLRGKILLMSLTNDQTGSAAMPSIFDVSGLATLKRHAKAGDATTNKAVAKQFEALFLQIVLKSMRDATPREGLFNSEQTQMYESLLDQQLGQALSSGSRGVGLVAMIEAQLARQNQDPQAFDMPLPIRPSAPDLTLRPKSNALSLPHRTDAGMSISSSMPRVGTSVATPSAIPKVAEHTEAFAVARSVMATAVLPQAEIEVKSATAAQREFVNRLLPAAAAVEQRTGIPAHFTVAHAALETGWGKSEPRHADGRPSFNLFGVKAGAGWRGDAVASMTTEVIAGVAQKRVERFRAYGSYTEAMNDYAQLLTSNPRYATVLGAREPARFAQGLQSAGFATDPLYASKLMQVIGSHALRQTENG